MAPYSVAQRSTCRVCGSSEVVCYLEFDGIPFTDELLSKERLGQEFLWPVRIWYCRSCNVSQTLHDVTVGDYYHQYQYTVSSSSFIQEFMRLLAEQTWQVCGLKRGDRVLEVGSGDGMQLSYFQKLGAEVFGFEPSATLAQQSLRLGVRVAQRLFDSNGIENIPASLLPVNVILLTYTFDHLPEPMSFVADIRKVIDPRRGVLIIEVHDLQKIFERNECCLFEHEHTIYCTEATLQRLLARAGFAVISTSLLSESQRRGNSLLLLAAPEGSDLAARAMGKFELARFGQERTYKEFGELAKVRLGRLAQYARSRRQEGRTLAGYGAGGRGVITMAMAGLDSSIISYLCDRNTAFHGLYTPRSHVPVVGPEYLLANPTDEVIVFSFGYMNEIRRQLGAYTDGGKLTSFLDLMK